EVGSVPCRIACEQAVACNSRMCADVEVRKGRASYTAALAVPEEALPGEEAGLVRERFATEFILGKDVLEVLDALEPDGNFRVDDRIDDEDRVAR
ncbi:MAG: hypothetical protein L0Y64_13590, partial [Myxococcaceae bacterium]|nr:hypothetical protein [Myxococcaceae bacterium]